MARPDLPLDARAHRLEEDLDAVSTTVLQNRDTLAEHGRRLTDIQQRLGTLESRFDGLESRFDGLEERVEAGFAAILARLDG
jgi:chromosome segregation ATPase